MSLDELSQIINSVQRPAPPPSGTTLLVDVATYKSVKRVVVVFFICV